MRTGTRGIGRGVVAGGWAVALVLAGACARHQGTVAQGARPAERGAAEQDAAKRAARETARKVVEAKRASGRYVGGAEDSVPVGYGTTNRRRMTGSVSTVSGDATRTQRVLHVEELLYRVPGVNVTPRGDGTYSITIRGRSSLRYGSTDPLFVFDGMPVEDGVAVLRTLAPEDVERIDVMKDAEASIYGARSANGVILVRTRHAGSARN